MPKYPRPQDTTIKNKSNLKKWIIYPDALSSGRFGGLNEREDETQQVGDFVLGENVTFANARIPTVRSGFDVIGTEATDSTAVKRAWVFENRNGEQYELKAYDQYVDYWLIGQSTEWKHLLTGLTPGLNFGYANIGKTSELTNQTLFCNGTDDWYKFSGSWTTYVSDNGSNIITVSTVLSTPAYLTTKNLIKTNYVDWAAVTNGSFRFTLDGVARNVDAIDFTGVTSMDDVATKIQTAIRALTSKTETVVWNNTSKRMVITSSIATTTSAITVLTTSTGTVGTDISGNGMVSWLNGDVGTVTNRAGSNFEDTGTIVDATGAQISYTGLDGYNFIGCSAVPATPTVGDRLLQAPISINNLDGFKSSVMMSHDGRVHARLDSKKSIWNYSKLDDYDDWTASTADGAGGAKEVEFGGPITSFGKLNKTALCLKANIIKTLSFDQVGTRLDSPVYRSLITADDKGTTLGAINQKSTFSTPMGLVFTTPDKRMVLLTGVTANNEPQYLFISDPVQPIFSTGVHDEATGICVDGVIWYAFKQNVDSTYNDVVIRGDMTRQTTTSDNKIIPIMWDTPYIGWNVADWTVVYDSTLGKNVVHWHSAINSGSYKVITDKTDATNTFSSTIRTWSDTFGLPSVQKKIDYFFLEVKMTENTQLLVTLLYDENGVTGTSEFTLLGTDTEYQFSSEEYNPIGSSPYGWQKFGSNELISDLKKYRFYLETENNLYFYNIAMQISSDDPGGDFQLIRFGYRLTETLEEPDRKLKFSANKDNVTISGGSAPIYATSDDTTTHIIYFKDHETPSGAKDGANTQFITDYLPIDNSVYVVLNGQTLNVGVDYSISGRTITMFTAPFSTDILTVFYRYEV